eukprot:gene4806-2491_t
MPPATPEYWHDKYWWRQLAKEVEDVIDRRELSYVLHYLKCKPTWACMDDGLPEQYVHESHSQIKSRTAYAIYRLYCHFKNHPSINPLDCYNDHNHCLHWPSIVTALVDSAPVRTWDFQSAIGGAGAFWSGKTKCPTVKYMVAVNLLGHIVHFSGPYPGNLSDTRIWQLFVMPKTSFLPWEFW